MPSRRELGAVSASVGRGARAATEATEVRPKAPDSGCGCSTTAVGSARDAWDRLFAGCRVLTDILVVGPRPRRAPSPFGAVLPLSDGLNYPRQYECLTTAITLVISNPSGSIRLLSLP